MNQKTKWLVLSASQTLRGVEQDGLPLIRLVAECDDPITANDAGVRFADRSEGDVKVLVLPGVVITK